MTPVCQFTTMAALWEWWQACTTLLEPGSSVSKAMESSTRPTPFAETCKVKGDLLVFHQRPQESRQPQETCESNPFYLISIAAWQQASRPLIETLIGWTIIFAFVRWQEPLTNPDNWRSNWARQLQDARCNVLCLWEVTSPLAVLSSILSTKWL